MNGGITTMARFWIHTVTKLNLYDDGGFFSPIGYVACQFTFQDIRSF